MLPKTIHWKQWHVCHLILKMEYNVFHNYLTDKNFWTITIQQERERNETAALGHANPGYHYGPKTGIQPSIWVSWGTEQNFGPLTK